MLSSALWLSGLVLEAILLVRGYRGEFLRRYKIFYVYVGWVLLRDLALVPTFHFWPNLYAYAYWYSQFFSVVVGCGIIWEIYRVALASHPGAARMARNVLPFLFVMSASRLLVNAWNNSRWLPGRTTLETERDLRSVQAALLVGLIALLAYYAIPIGRNLKGIIIGYAVFLGTSLIHLTFRHYLGDDFQIWWQYIQPVAYFAVLLIWCEALWNYVPNPQPRTEPRLESDYQALANATRVRLNSARSHLFKAMRP